VLDSLHAVIGAVQGKSEAEMLPAALKAAQDTVESFKGKPNKLGRARMFGDQSVGLVDPGQLAFCRIVEGLRG
jgi:dihydroxyacetone kinase-like protein